MTLALAAIRTARSRPTFAATVATLDGNGQWVPGHAVVNYSERTWRFRDAEGSCSYTPKGGWTTVTDGKPKRLARDRDGWVPEGLELLFPLELPMWGGETDEWRIVDAIARGEQVHLSLQHMGDPGLGAKATVSMEWGVVTEFITPWSEVVLRDIRLWHGARKEVVQESLFDL